MKPFVAVALGGAIGSVARYWVGLLVAARFGEAFPVGTLVINVAGSFVIGVFAAATRPDGPYADAATWRLFVMTGLCGGFTTFSAFSLQSWALMRRGAFGAGMLNVGLSVLLCLAAVALGVWGGERIR